MCGTTTRNDAAGAGARGSALLAVLWLTAALSAIAFSVANSVRGEIEHTATSVESLRAYYLATGALQRALLYMQWGPGHLLPGGAPRYWGWGVPRLQFEFPAGVATVEIVPESSKMNVNSAPAEELFRLLLALGAEPERAREIALAIVDWRTLGPPEAPGPYDAYYSSLSPSFRARHASFEEIEELLLVKGMTPDLFFGSYQRDQEGRLAPQAALKDCVTVYGGPGAYDVNTAQPAVMLAAGVPPEVVGALVRMRRNAPLRPADLSAFSQGAPGVARLRVGGNTIYTLRATAVLRRPNGSLSEQRRSVAATVKFMGPGYPDPVHVLRWYDSEWVQ